MKAKSIIFSCTVALVLVVGVVWALPVHGGSFQLHTIDSFVEALIERRIIPSSMEERARAFVRMINKTEEVTEEEVEMLNKEHARVEVSQFIEQANRTYTEGEDVKGLVLLFTNTAEEALWFRAVRRCHVVYRIYADDSLLYDSKTTEVCQTDETVTFELGPGAVRMFPITHRVSEYPLDSGMYRVEIEYPGYGSGTLDITIQ